MRRPGGNKTYEAFSEAAGHCDVTIRPTKRKRDAPLSIRFTREERSALKKAAGDRPLGAFIKARVFGDEPTLERDSKHFTTDHKSLAAVLGALGRSRLSQNLNQIAKSCHLGILPLTPDLIRDIEAACSDVRTMRETLLVALKKRTRSE